MLKIFVAYEKEEKESTDRVRRKEIDYKKIPIIYASPSMMSFFFAFNEYKNDMNSPKKNKCLEI